MKYTIFFIGMLVSVSAWASAPAPGEGEKESATQEQDKPQTADQDAINAGLELISSTKVHARIIKLVTAKIEDITKVESLDALSALATFNRALHNKKIYTTDVGISLLLKAQLLEEHPKYSKDTKKVYRIPRYIHRAYAQEKKYGDGYMMTSSSDEESGAE